MSVYAPRLLTPAHAATVRSLLLPRLAGSVPGAGSMDPADGSARALLPNRLLLGPGIGVQAEAIVLQWLGTDWPLFANPDAAIPSTYAQGDPLLARALVDDALVHFMAMRVVAAGALQQVVATQLRTADEAETFSVVWTQQEVCFKAAGYAALHLLSRAVAVGGRRFYNPTSAATAQMDHALIVPEPGRPRHHWDWD
jgi:hypothetical protein